MLQILHLEDDPVDAGMVLDLLREEGLEAESECVDTLAEFREKLGHAGYGLILSDYTIPGVDPMEALAVARQVRPELPFIFISGTIGEDKAIEALKLGASDYVLKQQMGRLVPCVRRALHEAEAREALRRAGEELRVQSVALQSAANAISITDRNGTIQWVNAAFERLTGYSAAELKGQSHRLLNPGKQEPGFYQRLWQTISAGQVWRGEVINQRKDGTFYDEEMTIAPVRDARGDITHFIAIKQDVTERKRMEGQLRERNAELDAERARWQGVVEGIADEVWTCDANGQISVINLLAMPAMGLPEFKGLDLLAVLQEVDIFNPDGQPRPAQDAPLLRSLRGEIVRGEEIMVHRRTGKRCWRQFSCAPTRDGTGAITGAVAIVRDITEQKRTAQALHEARDELARANADLERKVQDRTAQLVEANASLQTFAYTAAHDLRSPLRSIKSFSSIVLEECRAGLGEESCSLLERVAVSADQMSRLLEDLLEYSKMSQAELKLEPVDLDKAVGEALALLEGEIRGKNAAVTVVHPLPEVIGHAATVVLLINNLLSNALKFMAPGVQPQIRIWADRAGDRIRLSVEDNAIGIAPEHREKIFGAFERLHGKEAYPGTGLGLAIVRIGAERMGGRVGVESEPGKGSRFWVELRAGDQE